MGVSQFIRKTVLLFYSYVAEICNLVISPEINECFVPLFARKGHLMAKTAHITPKIINSGVKNAVNAT